MTLFYHEFMGVYFLYSQESDVFQKDEELQKTFRGIRQDVEKDLTQNLTAKEVKQFKNLSLKMI